MPYQPNWIEWNWMGNVSIAFQTHFQTFFSTTFYCSDFREFWDIWVTFKLDRNVARNLPWISPRFCPTMNSALLDINWFSRYRMGKQRRKNSGRLSILLSWWWATYMVVTLDTTTLSETAWGPKAYQVLASVCNHFNWSISNHIFCIVVLRNNLLKYIYPLKTRKSFLAFIEQSTKVAWLIFEHLRLVRNSWKVKVCIGYIMMYFRSWQKCFLA